VDHFGRREDGTYDEGRRAARITQLSAATPLGRLATPKDVADLTAFLASDEAEYITGQAINLVGGLIMH
jgi:3-oxoacyl-[acyl-carrier protein] reductase